MTLPRRFALLALIALAVVSGRPAAAAAIDGATPFATIDLLAADGVELVHGAWRYRDAEIVRVPFRLAGADGQPTGEPTTSWDIVPHAGVRGFDDHDWPVIEAGTLQQHRGPGRLSFAWYRIELTVPPVVDGVDTRGTRIEFETSIDDYAEVGVDGELPRAYVCA